MHARAVAAALTVTLVAGQHGVPPPDVAVGANNSHLGLGDEWVHVGYTAQGARLLQSTTPCPNTVANVRVSVEL